MTIGGELGLEFSHLGPGGTPSLESWRKRLAGETVLAANGRAALDLILAAIRRADPGVRAFLLPSYLCGSLLEPFQRAGIETRFFPMDADLRLPIESLPRLAREAGAGGLLFIDYFGRPLSAPERELLTELKASLWLVEDCVPGGLVEDRGREVGATGHFAFTSFRKYTPLPDGAVVWNRSGQALDSVVPGELPRWVQKRALARLLRAEFLRVEREGDAPATGLEPAFLELIAASEELIASEPPARGPSRLSLHAAGFDLDAAAAQRLRQERSLLRLFEAAPAAAARPLRPMADGAGAPNLLPLVCPDRASRDALRAQLARHRVFCAMHWPLPAAVPRDFCAASHWLAERMLCLPLDPAVGDEDVVRVHAAVREFRADQ